MRWKTLGAALLLGTLLLALNPASAAQMSLSADSDQSAATVNNVVAVACPSVSDCFAIADNTDGYGVILSTTDGGSTWVRSSTSLAGGDAIACPSTSACFIVGGENIESTTDAGSTWKSETFLAGVFQALTSVTCTDTTDCVAVGYVTTNGSEGTTSAFVIKTTDAGNSWVNQSLPSGVGALSSISCPTTTWCIATGSTSEVESIPSPIVLTSTDGGGTWTYQPTPPAFFLTSVTCTSSTW